MQCKRFILSQDDFYLCRRQGISGYPTLNLYTMEEGTKRYQGRHDEDDLIKYIVRHLQDRVIDIWEGNFEKWAKSDDGRQKPWLVFFCDGDDSCPDETTLQLTGNTLAGMTKLGVVDCEQDRNTCDELRGKGQEEKVNVLFFPEGLVKEEGKRIQVSLFDHKEIITMVLLLLPGKHQVKRKLLIKR